jgi:D-lactate dehydrogenase
MRIAYFTSKGWEKDHIDKGDFLSGSDVEFVFFKGSVNEEEMPEDNSFDAISVFVDSKITKEILDKFPNLKFIATRSTGFDHIDTKATKKKGIVVSSVPGYGENTVAEFAFALLLTVSRKIYDCYHRVREEGSFSHDGLTGFDLKGKTLGVIGTGRIGRNTIKIAQGFDMKIMANDAFPNEKLAQEFGFKYFPLEEVFANSDVITLHVPYMKETHHLINEDNVRKIKKGAVIINTSRGAVIETKAMASALKEGHLGGAGLDVLEDEDIIKDELTFTTQEGQKKRDLKTALQNHALIDMPNVIITPHNAYNTNEALIRILNTTLDNIKGFIDGKPVNQLK